MHEKERHRIILSAVQEKPVVTVQELVDLTGLRSDDPPRYRGASHAEAASPGARRRGGDHSAAISSASPDVLSASTRHCNREEARHRPGSGRAVRGRRADHHQWRHHDVPDGAFPPRANAGPHQLFPIAEHLLRHSKTTVLLPGGTIYREQNIILSPFDNDVTRNFYARRMFMGAQGLGPLGLMESDPLLIQAEQKLIDQAEELVVLIDSSKFRQRSSLILCPLSRIATVITDDGVEDREANMLENAGVRLIIARGSNADDEEASLQA